ncbi:TlpA family protein disulfide reductase [Amycolatopsis thermoflava]|uniref:TlpA family protein disulfide reductase n=1 Tax=Amycolatopsis thermoflava TaxID=84480 RepID=UPI003654D12E
MTHSLLASRRAAAAAAVVLATAVPMLAACGSDTATPAAPSLAASRPGEVATIAGHTVRVPGAKPTALFFFSVGCGECAGGAKSLAQAARAAGGKAEFLAVDMDPSESTQDITGFLKTVDGTDLPAAIDTGAALTQRFGVSALSTLVVVAPSGKVTYRATDPSPQAITTALDQAVAQ